MKDIEKGQNKPENIKLLQNKMKKRQILEKYGNRT
jgi:hypothetical protein